MGDLKHQATIKDVARHAGVSISTISHVFSGARPISSKTREKVLKAAEELFYRPNAIAQSMRMGDTGMISLLLRPRDAISGSLRGTETFERLIGAIASNVLGNERSLVLVQELLSPGRRSTPMDGCIIAYPYGKDEVLTYLMTHHVPLVMVDPDPDRPELPWAVHMDYETPMRELLTHIHERGARQILLLSGTEDNAWNRYTAEFYHSWVAEKCLPSIHLRLYEGKAADGAYQVVDEMLRSPVPPDAIIVASSTFAAGALDATHKHGHRVPDDILLAALADSEYTRNSNPGITALNLRPEDAAQEAVTLLLSRLEGNPPPQTPPRITATLRWRLSTG